MTPADVLNNSLPRNPRARRRVVAGIALSLTMSVTWAILAALTVGLPPLGKVAWADEVDKKINAAIDPVQQQVGKLEDAVKKQAAVGNSLMANITASQIRATYARIWCARPSPTETERERLASDLDRYLREYPKYADGDRFPVESLRCNSP